MNNRNELRKIIFSNGILKNEPGFFHQWGTTNFMSDADNKEFPVTTAIIELENGKVIEATPEDIKFVDMN